MCFTWGKNYDIAIENWEGNHNHSHHLFIICFCTYVLLTIFINIEKVERSTRSPTCPFIPVHLIPTVVYTILSHWPIYFLVASFCTRIIQIESSTLRVPLPYHCTTFDFEIGVCNEGFSWFQKVLCSLEAANKVQWLWAKGQVIDNVKEEYICWCWCGSNQGWMEMES